MNDFLGPDVSCIMTMAMISSLNLMFNEEAHESFKPCFIRCTRTSVSATMHELGNKSKNYYKMHDMSFWKLHDKLKDKLNTRLPRTSRMCREKWKK